MGKNRPFIVYLQKSLFLSNMNRKRHRELTRTLEDGRDDILVELLSEEPAPDEAALNHIQNRLLIDAVNSLPIKQRKVVVERYFAGWSLVEIAKKDGRHYMTEVGLCERALKNLRKLLNGYINIY
jgi:RNA polymerase sigma factor (sigma-70 family)